MKTFSFSPLIGGRVMTQIVPAENLGLSLGNKGKFRA
jgi:hypothetical protein